MKGSKYGPILQRKVTPTNPRSSKQLARRNKVAALSSQWRKLSDANREKWRQAMVGFPLQSLSGKGLITNPFHYFMAQLGYPTEYGTPSTYNFQGIPALPQFFSCTVRILRSSNRGEIQVLQSSYTNVYDAEVYFNFNIPASRAHWPNRLPYLGEISLLDPFFRQWSSNFSGTYGSLPAVGTRVFYRVILRIRPTHYRVANFEGSFIQPNN